MSRWIPYHVWDVEKKGLLPEDWKRELIDASVQCGVETILRGDSVTSREKGRQVAIPVRVTDGDAIANHVPWLWRLYEGPFREFASQCFKTPLYTAERRHTAININHISGPGARYEWHVDSNPVTALLFASDLAPSQGGALVFREASGRMAIVRPRAGTFICFDAREIPHRVAPLRVNTDRISLPMNYYSDAAEQERPEDLDASVYGRG